MKYENESDPSVNWGHLNAVDFTADTDHVSAEAAERYAYDQAELWAERQAEINAEAQAEREWMEQGGRCSVKGWAMTDQAARHAHSEAELWADVDLSNQAAVAEALRSRKKMSANLAANWSLTEQVTTKAIDAEFAALCAYLSAVNAHFAIDGNELEIPADLFKWIHSRCMLRAEFLTDAANALYKTFAHLTGDEVTP